MHCIPYTPTPTWWRQAGALGCNPSPAYAARRPDSRISDPAD